MNETAHATTQPYYDRSTGLKIFGILTIGLGGLAALMCLLMILGAVIQTTTAHVPFSTILPGLIIYGVVAVALVWLGIGSFLAKRWARALMIIFSWSWLIVGILAIIMMAFVLPKIAANASALQGSSHGPPIGNMLYVIFAIEFVIFAFLFIVLPAIWTYFYSSHHVKGTVHWRDPQPDWTDACPLPVLAFCLWMLFYALTVLSMIVTAHGVAPFFGIFITGLAGRTYYVGLAAIFLIAASLLYRVDLRGWWLSLFGFLVFVISGIITYSYHDISDLYRLMDYPEDQIQQMQKLGIFDGHSMAWVTGACLVPFLGYLIFIRRYFR